MTKTMNGFKRSQQQTLKQITSKKHKLNTYVKIAT